VQAADDCSEAYTPTPSLIQIMREELRVLMPNLANAPLLEARVCQSCWSTATQRQLTCGSSAEVRVSASTSHNSSWGGGNRRLSFSSPEAASQREKLVELRSSLVRFTHPSLTAPQYKADRGHLDEGFACLHPALVVLTQAAVSYQPRKSSLYYPPLRQDLEKPLACGFRSTISSSHPPYSSHQLANSSPP
jgi:hypothetical protein